jgi:hypothetical protein
MSQSFFTDKFGINQRNLENPAVNRALANGGTMQIFISNPATNDVLTFEENALKNASKNISQGVGIRVIAGIWIGNGILAYPVEEIKS